MNIFDLCLNWAKIRQIFVAVRKAWNKCRICEFVISTDIKDFFQKVYTSEFENKWGPKKLVDFQKNCLISLRISSGIKKDFHKKNPSRNRKLLHYTPFSSDLDILALIWHFFFVNLVFKTVQVQISWEASWPGLDQQFSDLLVTACL